ncbi:hypothetical protein ANCCAN_18990 [Ancylostoma caninum]|uniref:Uncharacterized protein n=1 Tax=Ancylostoma caninum TaxID=29170 RepID=A0A368FSK9_ANCCA|nr:hypothetical protein ANCCAN_18990 [Ancylostoma caninum]
MSRDWCSRDHDVYRIGCRRHGESFNDFLETRRSDRRYVEELVGRMRTEPQATASDNATEGTMPGQFDSLNCLLPFALLVLFTPARFAASTVWVFMRTHKSWSVSELCMISDHSNFALTPPLLLPRFRSPCDCMCLWDASFAASAVSFAIVTSCVCGKGTL